LPSAKPAKSDKGSQLRIAEEPGVSKERRLANVLLNPAVHTAATCVTFGTPAFGKTEITETLEEVLQTIAKVREGDLSGPEATLVSQAHSLNAIFSELARRSALNMGEYIEASEKYMKLALKAQAQCRATIETLAAIKNPPVVFAKQANIANGPQQVNNGPPAPPRADETTTSPNKLLEHAHEQRLDPGAPSAPVRSDPALEALEERHRA
jgi:hypothetical protein